MFKVTVTCIIKRFSHLNGKRLANLHDHMISCTKRPPLNFAGEDIEMMSHEKVEISVIFGGTV